MDFKKFEPTFLYKLIYIFRIVDDNHKGCLKIGETTIKTNKNYTELFPSCHDLNSAADDRISKYTSPAGIDYKLLYTEIAAYKHNSDIKLFQDHDVHNVLIKSGIKRKYFDTIRKQNEWFITDLETAKEAIKAVKEGRTALDGNQISFDLNPIILRPEQEKAIRNTILNFKKSKRMLWNAKMRFGKTVCALHVAKEMGFEKTIILTHRPVVQENWFQDFSKIFYEKDTLYSYGSKTNGKSIDELIKSGNPFIYFASLQDLRGSSIVGGNFEKNNLIFSIDWDFVVIDEAHEGTNTLLGKSVLKEIIKDSQNKTYVLELSGTPFNLISNFDEGSIFTWDYIMEQEAKNDWIKNNYCDFNPYEDLPRLNIYTYDLGKIIKNYVELVDKAFNFKEFFRTWTGDISRDFAKIPKNSSIGRFVHEEDVKSFLNLICQDSEKSNYPFSKKEYRDYFNHTLWVLPGVKEAKALSELLKKHAIFQHFKIVNIAGEGDDEIDSSKALDEVNKAITNKPHETYSITLTCGRLTTGVTVRPWTAVLMLSGSYSTQASQYLQTIFRVQSPAIINGKIKTECYVFDFAPDRSLKMIAESVQLSSSAGKVQKSEREQLGKFLNFCPVISVESTGMKEYKVDYMLQELKRAYADRVARNGFDDYKLYNDELLKLNSVDYDEFKKLEKIVKKSINREGLKSIEINSTGFTDEEYLSTEKEKKNSCLSVEEIEKLKELREKKKKRKNAISILRAISVRIPLLIYGMDQDIDDDISIESFLDPNLIDDESWIEFMPKGVTRDVFKKFVKYYDQDIFIKAGKQIRLEVIAADDLEPTERVKIIANRLSTFKNPDRETILTPWNVVNLHMSKTIGGYDFFEKEHSKENCLDEPVFVNHDLITKEIFNNTSSILEINSKTGLYPLYIAYSLYRLMLEKSSNTNLSINEKYEIWDKVVRNQLYIICKTNMAKKITKRTLVGYRNKKINTHSFDDLIMQLKDKTDKFIEKIKKPSFWDKGGNSDMKFNAIVGNPPYQGVNHQQIYPFFYLASIKIADYVSLIFPTGWQEPKTANNLSKMNTKEIKTDKQIVFIDNRHNVFPGISGAEWTNIILWKKGYDNGLEGSQWILTNGDNRTEVELLWESVQKPKPKEIIELSNIIKRNFNFISISEITSGLKPYGLRTDVISLTDEENYSKYNIEPLQKEKFKDNDIKIYAKSGLVLWVPNNYKFPKITKALNKYKVFIPYAWGNMSEKSGLGGAFSDIIIGSPSEACTETYLESGCFEDFKTAKKHAKYILTRFCRALLYLNKYSHHSTTSWGDIPLQDYHEEWWEKSIKEIDDELFNKYSIPNIIKQFVYKNIQIRSEGNIINYNIE